jgi:hypothetical protein
MSRESFHTSPSVSFEGLSLHLKSESNAITSKTEEKPLHAKSFRVKGRSVAPFGRNQSTLFCAVAEETEDDLRISMPSQREISKSTRLS